MKKIFISNSNFNSIVRARLHADDFAQPATIPTDPAYYKNKAIVQIENAIKAIQNSYSHHEFTCAIAASLAFISAAHDYEFIDLAEKVEFTNKVNDAVKSQVLEA